MSESFGKVISHAHRKLMQEDCTIINKYTITPNTYTQTEAINKLRRMAVLAETHPECVFHLIGEIEAIPK
jgi:hypothetical protein